QFANATSDDLWRALEEASREPVRRVMQAWVDRPGHPAIRVHRTPTGVRLEQSRFAFSGEKFPDGPWPIPLRLQDGTASRTVLFARAPADVPVADLATTRFNPDRTAFVRLWYEPALRRELRGQLPSWPSTDRWAFVNDTAAFVLSGDYAVADLL